MIQISERDKEFLLVVNETGACNSKLPLTIYPKRYCRSRLELMEKEKIVNRKYGLIMLGMEGKNYLESIGVIPKTLDNLQIVSQRRLARVTELKYLLPEMKVVTSAQYKKEKQMNRGMQFVAATTTKNNSTYLIYDVPKRLTIGTQTQLLKELRNKKESIMRAIIFTRNKDFVQVVTSAKVHIEEFLLLPPNDLFVNLINIMAEGDFDRSVIGAAFPNLIEDKIFSKKRSQYIIGGNACINMVLNNVSIFDMLSKLDVEDVKNDNFVQIYHIVCLDIQKRFLLSKIESLKLKKLNIQIKTIVEGESTFY